MISLLDNALISELFVLSWSKSQFVVRLLAKRLSSIKNAGTTTPLLVRILDRHRHTQTCRISARRMIPCCRVGHRLRGCNPSTTRSNRVLLVNAPVLCNLVNFSSYAPGCLKQTVCCRCLTSYCLSLLRIDYNQLLQHWRPRFPLSHKPRDA